jgi:hypothetical protein
MYWVNEEVSKVQQEGENDLNEVSTPQGVIDLREVQLMPGYILRVYIVIICFVHTKHKTPTQYYMCCS